MSQKARLSRLLRYDAAFGWIDRWVDVDPATDHELALKFRMLIMLACVSIVVVAVVLISAFSLSTAVTAPKIVGLIMLATFIAVPVIAIRTKKLALAAFLYIVLALAGIIAGCALNGGLASQFLVLLPLVPVLAGWLVGARTGLATGAVAIAAMVLMGSEIGAAWVQPSAFTEQELSFMRIVTAIVATVAAIVVAHCFQRISASALSQVRDSRDAVALANRAKSEFLANMSHEVRTPLNGVIAVAGALDRTSLNATQHDMVQLIISSGRTLERLVGDVLDVSKVESGKLEIERVPFNLRETVASSADLFRPLANEKGVQLSASFGSGANGTFLGDPTRIKQVVSNLLSNAVKFTAEGAITLRVDVDTSPSGEAAVTIDVQDTGIGFDTDQFTALFDPFAQQDSSINRQYGGSGLGLYICKSIVQAMGGEISAASSPGKGARFIATFELGRAAAKPERTEQKIPNVAGFAQGDNDLSGPISVLLAEDHPTNRQIVELILTPLDVKLTAVENGAEAVKAFKDNRFDFILMDMQMPVMDGLSATREIRRLEDDEQRGHTPLAMLTANAMSDHVADALAAGADKHIAKPVTPDSLIADIGDLLRDCGHPRGLAA